MFLTHKKILWVSVTAYLSHNRNYPGDRISCRSEAVGCGDTGMFISVTNKMAAEEIQGLTAQASGNILVQMILLTLPLSPKGISIYRH